MSSGLEWTVFAIANIPVCILIGWVFFRSWDRFWDAVLWMLTPDILSLFRGKLAKDWWGEFKFGYFLMACLVITAMESFAIHWLVEDVMK